MIRLALRTSQWLMIAVVLVLALLISLTAFLLYTPAGLHLAVTGAERFVPGLRIERAEGILGGEMSLHDVVYADSQTQLAVQLAQVGLSIRSRCLFQPSLCLDSLTVRGAHLSLPEDSQPSGPDDTDSDPYPVISLPVPITVSHFSLEDIILELPQMRIQWQQFSGGFSWYRSRLTLDKTALRQITVDLHTSPESQQTAASSLSSFSYPAVTLPEVWIPVDVRLNEFSLEGMNIRGGLAQEIKQLHVSGQAFRHRVRLQQLEVSTPELDVAAQGQATLSGGYPLNIQLNSVLHLPEINGQTVTAHLRGSLAKMKVDAGLGERVQADISAQLEPITEGLPFEITVRDFSGQWPLTGDSQYQLDLAHLNLKGQLDNYTLALQGQVDGKDIPSAKFDISGKGSLTQLDLATLQVNTLNGTVSGQSHFNWEKTLELGSQLAFRQIEPQAQWPDFPGKLAGQIDLNASLSDQKWQLDVTQLELNGELKQYPLHIAGPLMLSGETENMQIKASTPALVFSHGQNQIRAQGTLDQQWNMDVAVAIPDLSKSLPGGKGTIQGKIRMRGNLRHPEANVALTGKQLRWHNEIQAKEVFLKGKLAGFPEMRGDVVLNMTQGRYQDYAVKTLMLSGKGDLTQHQFKLDADAPEGRIQVQIAGSTDQTFRVWQGMLEQAELSLDKHHLTLSAPVKMTLMPKEQQLSVQAHCWRDGSSSLCLDQDTTISPSSGQFHLSLHQLDLSRLAHLLPEETTVEGKLNAQAFLKWAQGPDQKQPPEAELTVTVEQGQLQQQMETKSLVVAWQQMQLQMNLKDDHLAASGRIDLAEHGVLDLAVTIPDINRQQKHITGNIDVNRLDLSLMQSLLGDYSEFGSIVDGRLKVHGPILHPQIEGKLAVSQLQLQGEVTPVDIRQGNIDIRFQGYQAQLSALVQTPEGELHLQGDADWAKMDAWAVHSRLYADGVDIDFPPYVKLRAIPDMTLTLTPKIARVEGTVEIPEGDITVDELPDSAVRVSKDQVIIRHSQPVEQQQSLPFTLESHVTVTLGKKVRLSAFGLDGNLQGGLTISQRDNAPFMTGEVNILNGTYRSLGQDLVIQQGKVIMNGPVSQPYVAITAIRNPDNIEDDVTVGIKVDGPADNPSVSIFSNPAMAQANALSYLIRGQNLDAESNNGALTTSLIGLSLAQSGKLVGEIGQAFGVQDLQLDTSGAGEDSQVTVSGYILPGLQVKYGVGIFNSVGEFTVRYRLMSDLYIEAVSGLTSTMNVLYQFEFD
ncbi:autotransporter assembly complex protein TamB [Vibrio mangrovi]|uniref:Translocation and assembly module TamB n=1 Tax=Vibrio mangrovi TaxID=474394 RepID=A0A1Y6IZ76_9VIBR|nr:translocation/assembly module TamB domain-containing protein [Vibrio mangrovi]MDW6002830.1 translocation/assembly module TamB domain-containing protein [Vibrio mangrovi]SMS02321.1 Translocation and assembly module TamB [Vibrio mangrovi]